MSGLRKIMMLKLLGVMSVLALILPSILALAYSIPFSAQAAPNQAAEQIQTVPSAVVDESVADELKQSGSAETVEKERTPSEEAQPLDYAAYDEWIIKWKEEAQAPESADFTVLMMDEERQLMLIELAAEVEAEEWYAEWIDKEEIEYIEPNHTMKINSQPNDPEISKQEYLGQINAFSGWDIVQGNRAITIAILDTGVDLEHPDLRGNLVPGINLIERNKPPQDDNGHGTQVAGVLGALGNNQQGVAGILWTAKLMPVKVLDKEGEGTPFRVAQGIYQSIEKGASIVLLSLGDLVFSQTLLDAVELAEDKGVLVIAATGNEGARVNYPAAFPTVFAVGAVDRKDGVTAYSNSGPEVNVVAPGVVYTTRLGGRYGAHSGTSMAAPQVAGLAALVWAKYPQLEPSEVRNHIMYTARDVHIRGWDPQTGHGRIDVARALQTRPVHDMYEPNDVMSQAAPFPIETMVRAELRNKEDVDWFQIEAPYRGQIELSVSLDVAKANGIDLTFYTGDKGEQSFLYNIKKERKIEFSVPKGRSYIRLKYNQHERRSTPLKYTLVQSFSIYADSQQPNNSKGQATQLQGDGQVLTGTFHRNYLNHWYYFDVPKEGQLELYLTTDTLRLDPVIYFERPDGRTQTIDEGGAHNNQQEYLVTEVQPGRHYFRVSHYYGHKVNGEYYLRFHYRPLFEDVYEPNNRLSQATRIETGQRIRAQIRPRSDLDWYRISVGKNRYLQVQLSELPEQVGLEVKLLNTQQDLITSRKQVGRERSFELGDKLEGGTYYLVVSADREFPFESYLLSLTEVELLFGFRDISGHWAAGDIVEATRQGLVQGVGDYRFAPNEVMNRAAVATLLNRLYPALSSLNSVPFKDVPSTHWAHESIALMSAEGLIQGFPDGTFQPEKSITRAEVAAIFDRILAEEQRYARAKYTDVPHNHWAQTSISRLSAKGLLSGYGDGLFRPNQSITRAEFVTLVQRVKKL